MTEQKTEQKHTPGPWVVEHGLSSDPAKYTPGIDAVGENFTVILYGIKNEGEARGIRGRTDEEQEANARLIAAAPELLEALREVLKHEKWHAAAADEVTPSARAAIKRADAVIAKATGQEPRHD